MFVNLFLGGRFRFLIFYENADVINIKNEGKFNLNETYTEETGKICVEVSDERMNYVYRNEIVSKICIRIFR